MKLNNWVNTFHKTECKSSLTEEMVMDIEYKIYDKFIDSSHKDYRKLQALNSKLCPHYNGIGSCACGAANRVVK